MLKVSLEQEDYIVRPCHLKIKQNKQTNKKKQDKTKLGMVAHAFNPSTREAEAEAEAGEFLSSRPAWSTK